MFNPFLFLGGGLLLVVFGICLIWMVRRPAWMGFRGKTLWDWVGVLSMPTLVGLGSLMLGLVQTQLGALRAEEQAFQTYLDRVSAMDLSDTDIHALARAQTGAVLTQVTGPRAARVLSFLDDLGMTAIVLPDLEEHDLRGAELKDRDLSYLNFEAADLRRADFEGAALIGTSFEEARLSGADFKSATLTEADFSEADMRGVSLDYARLDGADLALARHLDMDAVDRACLTSTALLPVKMKALSVPTTGCTAGALQEDD